MPRLIAITGCSRGIGLALAEQYLQYTDCKVFAGTRNAAPSLIELQKSRPEYAQRLVIVEGQDMSLPQQAAQVLIAVLDALGEQKLDVLVHNAGLYLNKGRDLLENLDAARMSENIYINTVAPLIMTKCLFTYLAKGATIAGISSKLGSISLAATQDYSYSISKAGMNMGFQLLAQELRSKNIGVLIISPGWVKTDMGGSAAPLDLKESVSKVQKMIDSHTIGSPVFVSYSGSEIPW